MEPGPNGASGASDEDPAIAEETGEIPGRLDPATVEAIGDALQTYYRALIEEPLPPRLLALLARLQKKEGNGA